MKNHLWLFYLCIYSSFFILKIVFKIPFRKRGAFTTTIFINTLLSLFFTNNAYSGTYHAKAEQGYKDISGDCVCKKQSHPNRNKKPPCRTRSRSTASSPFHTKPLPLIFKEFFDTLLFSVYSMPKIWLHTKKTAALLPSFYAQIALIILSFHQ